MRLIHIDEPSSRLSSTLSLVECIGTNIPPYLILSHTWGEDKDEVTFKDMRKGRGHDKLGYSKIKFCVQQALEHGLRYFWVDTCLIDKSSSAELSEAINSMHRWYQNAAVCVVLLSDVSPHKYIRYYDPDYMDEEDEVWMENTASDIRRARWFTRGWTLQELLAPRVVKFYYQDWGLLGDREELVDTIHEITRINKRALLGAPLSSFSVEERLSWAEGRSTKREEDMAYSLLGLFDVHMPLLYGEGKTKALNRLKREVAESMQHASPQPSPTIPQTKQQDVPRHVDMEDSESRVASPPRKPIDVDDMLIHPFFPGLLHPLPVAPHGSDSFATQALDVYRQSKHPPADAYTQRKANLGWRMMAMSLLPRSGNLGVNRPSSVTAIQTDTSTPTKVQKSPQIYRCSFRNFRSCLRPFTNQYDLTLHQRLHS